MAEITEILMTKEGTKSWEHYPGSFRSDENMIMRKSYVQHKQTDGNFLDEILIKRVSPRVFFRSDTHLKKHVNAVQYYKKKDIL